MTIDLPPRVVCLVLVTRAGAILGQWPAFPVDVPWWAEVESVVRRAKELHGVTPTVLRLLDAERSAQPGGAVTYLAEVEGGVVAERWDGMLDEHPLRLSYARPGGPAADLEWADAELAKRGMDRIAPALQIKTWNLSSLWRLPVRGQDVWLKVVPSFFAHEGDVIARLAGGRVPTLVAHDRNRILMNEIPGEDLFGASLPNLVRMVPLLVEIQRDSIGRVDEWLALGLPDWRGPALTDAIVNVIDRTAAELSPADLVTLREFADGLPSRFRDIAVCGIPDTLVHGDFHPGNVRGDGTLLVALDWGDSGVGHPMLDQSAFLGLMPSDVAESIRSLWNDLWRTAVPGSDPARAASLLAPVAAARMAVVYRRFLDRIEPSEHPYHRSDPAEWLGRTATLVRASGSVRS